MADDGDSPHLMVMCQRTDSPSSEDVETVCPMAERRRAAVTEPSVSGHDGADRPDGDYHREAATYRRAARAAAAAGGLLSLSALLLGHAIAPADAPQPNVSAHGSWGGVT